MTLLAPSHPAVLKVHDALRAALERDDIQAMILIAASKGMSLRVSLEMSPRREVHVSMSLRDGNGKS